MHEYRRRIDSPTFDDAKARNKQLPSLAVVPIAARPRDLTVNLAQNPPAVENKERIPCP